MQLFLNILFLLIGFVLLIKGADLFVDGASSLAKKLGIPSLVVGLTIVAMGTGAPELAISVTASASGANDMAVSNVVGSNLFNLLAVLGICSLVMPLTVDKNVLKRDFPVCMGATVLMTVMLMLDGALSRFDCIILLVLMAGYLVWTVLPAMKNKSPEKDEGKPFSPLKCAAFLLGGLAMIVVGGNVVVDTASFIGSAFGMSEALIGLTICAVGTSLPELVTSITAAKKGETDMAIGNVVGSNLSNILLTLGVSGAISEIAVNPKLLSGTLTDCIVVSAITLIAFVFCMTGKKIQRWEGALLTAGYVGYMIYAVIRDVL